MQETRPKADAGRGTRAVADHPAHALQRLDMRRVAVDIGEQRDIVAGSGPPEMRLQHAGEAAAARIQRRRVRRVGEQRDPVGGANGFSAGSAPVFS